MRALTLALLLAALTPATAHADPGWTVQPGQALEGGDKLYCGAPCDVHGIRNIQSPRLDIAAGNSDPNAGPLMTGAIGFCWDITCTVTIYNGHGIPLFQVTPAGSYLRAPSGRLLAKFDGRGITLYAKPRYR